jgi:hypothetical protein
MNRNFELLLEIKFPLPKKFNKYHKKGNKLIFFLKKYFIY